MGQTSTGDVGANGRITCTYIDNREILIAADITIDGNMAGDIISTHSINDHTHIDSGSSITIGGNLQSTARIEVVDVSGPAICTFGSDWATESELSGTMTIAGNATGDIITYGDLNALVDIAGDFGGHIECVDLNGDLFIGDDFNDAGSGDEIEISGVVAGGVNIHVNHQLNLDGRWQNNASMKIGGVVHDNTWDAINKPSVLPHLWVISEYRGDCNNDNVFDAFDIEPFLDIMFERDMYLSEHPGLFSGDLTAEELMIYHGDSNCDGVVDAFDIEAFLAKLYDTPESCTGCWCSGKCCDPAGCNFCRIILPRGSTFVARVNLFVAMAHVAVHHMLGGADPADRIIALFLDNVDSRYYPRLIDMCRELVVEYDRMGDSERSEKWLRVLMALSAR
ncbi:MAG: MoaD/ThiS family protein [Planctomycetes bacterium]|nr:MoaD/ThiS family protein [Planctomycetota bacterium]